MSKLIYMSRNCKDRQNCAEEALQLAKEKEQDLVFVAALDRDRFSDLSESMIDLAADELKRLLTIQLKGSAKFLDAENVDFEVIVKTGGAEVELDETAISETSKSFEIKTLDTQLVS